MKKLFLLCLVTLSVLYAKDSVEFKYADENTQRQHPTSQNFILSYNNIIEIVRTSVVNISAKKTITGSSYDSPYYREQRGVPQGASGSGVIISTNGYIVTNNHVVDGADEITVTIAGHKKEYKAKLIGKDAKSDVAIIKIEGERQETGQWGTFYTARTPGVIKDYISGRTNDRDWCRAGQNY